MSLIIIGIKLSTKDNLHNDVARSFVPYVITMDLERYEKHLLYGVVEIHNKEEQVLPTKKGFVEIWGQVQDQNYEE